MTPKYKSFHHSCYGLTLPFRIQSPNALSAWHMWLDDLNDRHKRYKTERAITMLFNRIEREKWSAADFIEAIENGIERGYLGLFKPFANAKPLNRAERIMMNNLNSLKEIMEDE